jgi:serine/threonine protein kinase
MERIRCPYCGEENQTAAAKCAKCNRLIDYLPTVAVLDFFTAVQAGLAHKYELVAEIGQGGNASVFQAIQKNLDRKVALKVLLPHLVNDRDFLERFHLEARAIAKLRHPHIVTIYDEGSENGVHYMAMEFLEGKDLHHLLKERGRLSINEAIEMARCIAGALDYAHSYGFVHRDVKSSNIIMTTGRTAVLMDFGIAQADYSSIHTRIGSVLGTPEFMSPEQAAGKPVDSRSDFFSLGVVLYQTLSGRYPFKADNPISTIYKILHEDPVPVGKLVNLPPSVEHAINRCLQKDPAKRVANGKELIDLLSPRPTQVRVAAVEVPRSVEAPRSVEEARSVEALRPKEAPRSIRKTSTARRPIRSIIFSLTVVCTLIAGYVVWQRSAVADVPPQRIEAYQPAESGLKDVPNVVGRTEEEAISMLKSSGFQTGRVGVVAVPEPAASWKVESQRPAQGTKAKPGIAVNLLIAATPTGGQTFVRPRQFLPNSLNGITVSYKPVEVNPFDGFNGHISLGILNFTGPEGKETDFSAKFYEALRAANQSFRIFPYSTLKAEQNALGLSPLTPSSKQVLSALGDELSLDFVITGVLTDEADSSFTLQLIRCAGGITVFSEQFKTSVSSRALDDAVMFLVKRQVPVYAQR